VPLPVEIELSFARRPDTQRVVRSAARFEIRWPVQLFAPRKTGSPCTLLTLRTNSRAPAVDRIPEFFVTAVGLAQDAR